MTDVVAAKIKFFVAVDVPNVQNLHYIYKIS